MLSTQLTRRTPKCWHRIASFSSLSGRTRQKTSPCGSDVEASSSLTRLLQEDEGVRNSMAYCLSFSADEQAFSTHFPQLSSLMQSQLKNSKSTKESPGVARKVESTLDTPLPRTLQDALRPQKNRAIVITEAVRPFRVVDVNACWENLCGYSFVESKGKTLGCLLKGPDTNAVAATGLITQLLHGEEAGVTLTNYTKAGRPFRNRIRVAPLKDENTDTITHFVGVLQEVENGISAADKVHC